MDFHGVGGFGLGAFAFLDDLVLQAGFGHFDAFLFGVLFQEFLAFDFDSLGFGFGLFLDHIVHGVHGGLALIFVQAGLFAVLGVVDAFQDFFLVQGINAVGDKIHADLVAGEIAEDAVRVHKVLVPFRGGMSHEGLMLGFQFLGLDLAGIFREAVVDAFHYFFRGKAEFVLLVACIERVT